MIGCFHVVFTWFSKWCMCPDDAEFGIRIMKLSYLLLTHWGWDKLAALFADDIFKCIFLDEYIWILTDISLKFVPWGLINNIPALVQIMAWHRPGDKPLSEPVMASLLTHICFTRPQGVKEVIDVSNECHFTESMLLFWYTEAWKLL